MARKRSRPESTESRTIECLRDDCPICGGPMWIDYENQRTVTTLQAVIRLTLKVRRCQNPRCARYRKPYRPEEEGRLALPGHEFGLDVIAMIGTMRYQKHATISEVRQALQARGVEISERTVTNLLHRYDELLALSLRDNQRLQAILAREGRVILAIDGLQPDVGHEVLWVLRDCLSGEVLLARPLLSARAEDLMEIIKEVEDALRVPIEGIISDGQQSIRKAVAGALPDLPHGLCHFHYLREAAKPIYEADRHAKKELKKRVRGVRPIERSVEGRQDVTGEVIQGYCVAVRSALTDDGRPPMMASGLRLHHRLSAIAESLERAGKKGRSQRSWKN